VATKDSSTHFIITIHNRKKLYFNICDFELGRVIIPFDFSGLLEAVGKEATRHPRPESDLKENEAHGLLLSSSYSPSSSSSSHASRKATPPLLGYRLRTGSDPVLNGSLERPLSALAAETKSRPDPTSRLEGTRGGGTSTEEAKGAPKGLTNKPSPRLG
jgi:hypothetical protein